MRKTLIVLTLAALTQAPAALAQQTDVMAVVHKFVDGFNKGDMKSALTACAEPASIIDEFPPHEWHGVGACARWAADYDADSKKNGITDGVVTMGTPKHVDVTGDRAYVVVPVGYAFKQNGKPVNETGSVMTVALSKGAPGWRITAWTWTKN
jgi:hypothetical protein